MKIRPEIFFICLVILGGIPACVKNTGNIDYKPGSRNSTLTVSNSVLKKGEPLTVSTHAPVTHSFIRWTINPSAGTTILPGDNQASITFSVEGIYRIVANYYSINDSSKAYDSSFSVVTVNDSVYSAPPVGSELDTLSLLGDQITLMPVSLSASGLTILAKTSKLYNCTPYITAYAAGGQISASLLFNFNSAEVVEGKIDCMGVKNPATATITFGPAKNGTYNFSAELNLVTYEGQVTVTDSEYQFIWNYSSGIVISPLQISKK
jgi:hypothetical protein